ENWSAAAHERVLVDVCASGRRRQAGPSSAADSGERGGSRTARDRGSATGADAGGAEIGAGWGRHPSGVVIQAGMLGESSSPRKRGSMDDDQATLPTFAGDIDFLERQEI